MRSELVLQGDFCRHEKNFCASGSHHERGPARGLLRPWEPCAWGFSVRCKKPSKSIFFRKNMKSAVAFGILNTKRGMQNTKFRTFRALGVEQ